MLHRHSSENYLLEEAPIKEFCGDRAPSGDSSEEPLTGPDFRDFVQKVAEKFKDLLILDVVRQDSNIEGVRTFFKNPDRFFKDNFREREIQKQQETAAESIHPHSTQEAQKLVERYLEKHRLIDILPGHFAFGLMRRLISDKVGKSIRKDEIRPALARRVWQLVDTRDHRSLKRRLQRAVREAEQIRKTSRN